jgi:pimeloyl-ACP methyl ester carboxylesterase
MPIIRVNGKRINYWVGRGRIVEGKGSLLFLHGAGGSQYTWSFQKGFFEKYFNPILLELPGHGESTGDGEEEIGQYTDHVISFLQAMRLWKVSLVGHSMGGAIVQTLALSRPEMVRKIVLVGTGARLRVFPAILKGIRSDFEETVRKITRFAFSRNAPPLLLERSVSDLMQCRPETLYGDFLACDRFDLMADVEKIDIPTLVLCGDGDELTPVKFSEFLHHRIKGSEMKVLPRAGHMVMMEAPQAFNEKVSAFLVNPTVSGNS